MNVVLNTHCPICGTRYDNKEHHFTSHHIFLQRWYGSQGLKVCVCQKCHNEFHNVHFLTTAYTPQWIVSVCVQNWVKFCKIKKRNAYIIYPELMNLKPML